jgi:hypothetical protein
VAAVEAFNCVGAGWWLQLKTVLLAKKRRSVWVRPGRLHSARLIALVIRAALANSASSR